MARDFSMHYANCYGDQYWPHYFWKKGEMNGNRASSVQTTSRLFAPKNKTKTHTGTAKRATTSEQFSTTEEKTHNNISVVDLLTMTWKRLQQYVVVAVTDVCFYPSRTKKARGCTTTQNLIHTIAQMVLASHHIPAASPSTKKMCACGTYYQTHQISPLKLVRCRTMQISLLSIQWKRSPWVYERDSHWPLQCHTNTRSNRRRFTDA